MGEGPGNLRFVVDVVVVVVVVVVVPPPPQKKIDIGALGQKWSKIT